MARGFIRIVTVDRILKRSPGPVIRAGARAFRHLGFAFVLLFLSLAFLLNIPSLSLAEPLDNWTWRNPLPSPDDQFRDVTYGESAFVAVGWSGTGGRVLSSPDGATWTSRKTGTATSLMGVAYGNSTFVAVGEGHEVLTSPDGATWTRRPLGYSANLYDVAYANATFVAVGWPGIILTSPDGETWTVRTSGTTNALYAVTYGNGTFVAVGTETILTSADGVSWTSRTHGTTVPLYGVAYGNSTFVVVGESGTKLTSPDGVTWSTISDSGTTLYAVGYVDSLFVAAGWQSVLQTSPDGTTWTSRNSGTVLSNTIRGVAFGSSTFVAVSTGNHGEILTSPDAFAWTAITSGTTETVSDIIFANDTFVAVGGNVLSDGVILTSSDGVVWTERAYGLARHLYGVAYGNSTFVAVGDSDKVLTSPDGVTWTTRSPGPPGMLGVTFGGTAFVAVGWGGTIMTSPDGVNWTQRTSGTTQHLWGVAYGNSTFVAVGNLGIVLTSPDGISWTSRSSGSSEAGRSITFADAKFVAVGGETIISSPDGITWTTRYTNNVYDYLHGVAYGSSTFVVTGKKIMSSPDGITWESRTFSPSQTLGSAAHGRSSFVSVGAAGAILQSDNLAPVTTASPPGGQYGPTQNVTLSCDPGVGPDCDRTYYTLDGSAPTISSTQYVSAIAISTDRTLRFFSTNTSGNAEDVLTEVYFIGPAVTASAISGNTGEDGTSADFTVRLLTQPDGDVVIDLASSDAAEGTPDSSTLTFSTGNWNGLQTVTVTGVNDDVADGNQDYSIALSVNTGLTTDTTGYSDLSPISVDATNVDDDTPGFTVSAISGDTIEDGTEAAFTMKLNTEPDGDVVLDLASSDETEGVLDVLTLTFGAGNWDSLQTVTVTGINDDVADGDQAFSVALSVDPGLTTDTTGYAGLSSVSVAVTNVDDDTAGFLVSAISGNTGEDGTSAEFTVRLLTEPDGDVVIDLASSDDTEGTVSPAQLIFDDNSWASARTVTVTGVDDGVDDNDIVYSVELTLNAGLTTDTTGYASLNPPDVTVTNADDEVPAGGGGGGGCNTVGPAPGDTLWPDILAIALLAGILIVSRRRLATNS